MPTTAEDSLIKEGQQRLMAARERAALMTKQLPSATGTRIQPILPDTCSFCGVVLEPLVETMGITIPKPCSCDKAVTQRQEYEQQQQNNATRQQAEKQQRLIDSIRRMFGELPEKFKDRTFENFRELSHNKAALAASRIYSEKFPSSSGMLFFGDVGTGKTHLASAIAHEQILRGHSVLFGTVPSLLSRIKATFNDSSETEHDVMSIFARCDLLVMDDLGKEKVSEWVEERLYEIVNSRYERNLPIIITTNAGLKTVKDRYTLNGAAIVSRLYEMCPQGVMIKGPDYRMKKGMM